VKLDEAIGQQIVRFTNSEEPKILSNDDEVRNLLNAFVSLINAYLKRLGGVSQEPHPEGRSPDLIASMG